MHENPVVSLLKRSMNAIESIAPLTDEVQAEVKRTVQCYCPEDPIDRFVSCAQNFQLSHEFPYLVFEFIINTLETHIPIFLAKLCNSIELAHYGGISPKEFEEFIKHLFNRVNAEKVESTHQSNRERQSRVETLIEETLKQYFILNVAGKISLTSLLEYELTFEESLKPKASIDTSDHSSASTLPKIEGYLISCLSRPSQIHKVRILNEHLQDSQKSVICSKPFLVTERLDDAHE
jgi:hypothetical protein